MGAEGSASKANTNSYSHLVGSKDAQQVCMYYVLSQFDFCDLSEDLVHSEKAWSNF